MIPPFWQYFGKVPFGLPILTWGEKILAPLIFREGYKGRMLGLVGGGDLCENEIILGGMKLMEAHWGNPREKRWLLTCHTGWISQTGRLCLRARVRPTGDAGDGEGLPVTADQTADNGPRVRVLDGWRPRRGGGRAGGHR